MIRKLKAGIAGLLAMAIMVSLCSFGGVGITKAHASAFSGELKAEHQSISDAAYPYGLVFTGGGNGKYATLTREVYGDFNVKFALPNTEGGKALKNLRFDFIATDGRAFAVGYTQAPDFTGFYVEVSGEKAGIYYGPNVQTYTSEKNADGKYTAVTGNGDLQFRLDVDTMSVYASGGGDERLVWCFTQKYNDGSTLNTVFDPFTEYKVSVCFEKVETGKTAQMYLYSICGQSYTNEKITDTGAPSVFALADTRPVLHQPYLLPVPGVFDVMDEDLSAEDVQITIETPSAKKSVFNYELGAVYTFKESGAHKITYSVKDAAGKRGTYTFTVQPIREIDILTRFVYDYDVPEGPVGAGSVIRLPGATVATNRSTLLSDVRAQVTVTRDGKVVETKEGILSVTLPGTYTVEYAAVFETARLTETFTLEVKDGLAVLSDVNLQPVYTYRDSIAIPEATITVGDSTYNANVVLTAPSGLAYTNRQVTLEEEGTYIVTYSATTPNQNYVFEKEFQVVRTGADLFVDVNGKSTFAAGSAHFYKQATGVMLSMSSGAEVWYTNVLDMSNATRSDFFITYYIVPSTTGAADFGAMRFYLVDKYDENNYVEILTKDSGAINTGGVGSYNQAGSCGQTLGAGYEISATMDTRTEVAGGMTTLAGFRGTPFQTHQKSALEGGFALDYTTKQIFPKSSYAFSVAGSHPTIYQLTDLDNPNFYNEPWKGFTTGECYLKIVPEQVGARANVLITSIGGVSLSAETTPQTYAPKITMGEYEKGLPEGVVGMAYPIPVYTAVSGFYGPVESECHVYYQFNGQTADMDIIDGAFIPQKAGEYTIEIIANNPDGVSVTKTYALTVKDKAPDLSVEAIEKEKVLNGTVGTKLNLASSTVAGCLGTPSVKISVVSPSGEETPVITDFIPNRSGTWTVKYEVTDYLGRTAQDTYTVDITRPDTLVLATNPSLPVGFVNGFTYNLPGATALDYSTDELNPSKVDAKVFVTDASGRRQLPDDGKYVADIRAHNDPITVEYVFDNGKDMTEAVTHKAKGLIVTTENKLNISNYFVTEGITKTESLSEYTIFSFSKNASISFSRPLLASSLKTIFNVDPSFNNYRAVRITLVDSQNANEAISFVVSKKSAEDTNSTFKLGDNFEKDTLGSFYGNSADSFMYTYSNLTKSIIDASGNAIANVKTTVNGEPFNGFSSGMVYVRFDFEGVTGSSKFRLNSLGGQVISDITSDRVAPNVVVQHSVAGIHKLNSTVTIPSLMAADVLNEVASATVTVVCGDKVVLDEKSAFETHQLTLSDYGKYFVTYKVKDTAGRTYTTEEMMYVRGEAKTSVESDGKIKSTASVGDTVTLPAAEITDGVGDTNYYILVRTPESQLYRLEGNSVTFDREGDWLIRYFAYDAFYNCSYTDYTVHVK